MPSDARLLVLLLAAGLTLAACAASRAPQPAPAVRTGEPAAVHVIPTPRRAEALRGEPFRLTAETRIQAPRSAEAQRLGRYLADLLRPATGFALPVGGGGASRIVLESGADLGAEGYELTVTASEVRIRAAAPAGWFYGIQTLRQLLPAAIESGARQDGPWTIDPVLITDSPRYPWRGAMLDVTRHFFGPQDVKRYIDLLAAYKINRLHLHLSDDQGWRIEIKSRPRLTEVSGLTQVGGGRGGFYTQAEYADLVRYAQDRMIVVVPEIDLPGHTNAALAAYPELNCDGKAREIYTGIEVGFSAVCVEKEETYAFIDDVMRELAALTPGPYLHIGGDEVHTLKGPQYNGFMERAQEIVRKHGKIAVGWDEIAESEMLPTTIVQHWAGKQPDKAITKGAKLIMSPAEHAYIDMKYTDDTKLGLKWAGLTDTRDAYEWDPVALVGEANAAGVLGVEAALWSETLLTIDDIEYMAFPRLPGIAEIGWSPPAGRTWATYRERLALQAPRWQAMGVNFHRDPGVEWAP